MAGRTLQFGGVTADVVFNTLLEQQIPEADARRFVAGWIWENAYGVGRTFHYGRTFAGTDPADAPAPFVREFQHVNWLDGESAVQAGETPTEEGFNERFHKIERDLDRLGALQAQAFVNFAAMRAALHTVLEEIRDELNRINADLADVRASKGVVSVAPNRFESATKFLGVTKYFEKPVQVWQGDDGRIITIPTMDSVVMPGGDTERAPKVADLIARDPELRAAFPAEVRVGTLIDRFGDRMTSDGQTLAQKLAVLPNDATFPTLDATVTELSQRDAALLTGLGQEKAVRATLGVAAGDAANAPAARVEGVSAVFGEALTAANLGTIGRLADANPAAVVAAAEAHGVPISTGEASAIIARARTFRHF